MSIFGKKWLEKHNKKFLEAIEDTVKFEPVAGLSITTTNKKVKEYKKWVKKHTLPLEKQGAIGGEFTFCLTPTSVGIIYIVKHVHGAEFDFTVYELW